MPPHIIINETMVLSQRQDQPEKRYRILPPSESIEVLRSRVDPPEEPLSGGSKKYKISRSMPTEELLEELKPMDDQNQHTDQHVLHQRTTSASGKSQVSQPGIATVISPIKERHGPSNPATRTDRQPDPVGYVNTLNPAQDRVVEEPESSILTDQQEQDRMPTKRYHILTMKEKIAIALRNAELQNESMQARNAPPQDRLEMREQYRQEETPIFKSVLASESSKIKPHIDGDKRYRIVRKSDYLRIFKEQSMKSHAIEDSILDELAQHNDLDTIGATSNPQYQQYLEFQNQLAERRTRMAAAQSTQSAQSAKYATGQNNQSADSLEADALTLGQEGPKKSKHILEALKAQTRILNQLKKIKTDSMVSALADASMDAGFTAPPASQINHNDLMTNEAIHNELLKRLQADLVQTRTTQRPKGTSQVANVTENSLRESDIIAGQTEVTGKRSTSQSNVHRLKEKPLVDYTPPGSVNASLIQHSPRQTMSISTEINLPVLSKSFVNRLLTEATKRREFAEESIHAIPELGMLFRKADTTASKLVTSLSQDALSEFVTVVANEIINAFEEVVMEEAGGLENLSRVFSSQYFSRKDIVNEIHNSGL